MELEKGAETYHINSKNRVSGTHGDFTFKINLTSGKFNRVVCTKASIPKSYYLVPSGATFILTEGLTDTTITFPAGNYNLKAFRTAAASLLNSNSPNHWVYSVSYPTSGTVDTGKLTFAVSGHSSQPALTFGTKLFEQFGFEANSTNSFVSGTLTSTNVINLQKEATLFMHSNLCQEQDNVLFAAFASNSADFGTINYEAIDIFSGSKTIANSKSNIFRFYLTDEDDNPIDLNGQNVVMELVCFKWKSNFDLTALVATN